MGLDVVAYSHLKNMGMPDGYELEDFCIWDYDDITEDNSFIFYRSPENEYGVKYTSESGKTWRGFDKCEDLEPGIYHETHETSGHSFCAGSYSRYNGFRASLSLCVNGVEPTEIWTNPDKWKDHPLYELIEFSDCEGRIGPEISKKLYLEMKDNHIKFLKYIIDSPGDLIFYKEKYEDFMLAFQIASENGVVIFH
jgi:hypothetical protein